jgi:hypothetical protein
MVRRPRYANVVASLALFFALGGTAAAAVTLERDSVGSVQIRADAVRSPEIRADAVRSSEIGDESIMLRDLSPGVRTAVETEARFGDQSSSEVPSCPGSVLTDCLSIIERRLRPGSWLIHAKLVVDVDDDSPLVESAGNKCGLVVTGSNGGVLDEVVIGQRDDGERIPLALLGIVTEVEGNPSVSVRCTEALTEDLDLEDVKLAAVEAGSTIED